LLDTNGGDTESVKLSCHSICAKDPFERRESFDQYCNDLDKRGEKRRKSKSKRRRGKERRKEERREERREERKEC